MQTNNNVLGEDTPELLQSTTENNSNKKKRRNDQQKKGIYGIENNNDEMMMIIRGPEIQKGSACAATQTGGEMQTSPIMVAKCRKICC